MTAILDDLRSLPSEEFVPTWKHKKNTTPCSRCGTILQANNIGAVSYKKQIVDGETMAILDACCRTCMYRFKLR